MHRGDLLPSVQERPNDELNAINWLATYLHNNNPNNNLMRKVDDLAADLRADRRRRKAEAQEALEVYGHTRTAHCLCGT